LTIAKLSEAKALAPTALTGKTWKIKIIEGDRQGSSAYYPKEALESGKHLFSKGVRIFRNHPSESAKWEQPERKIEDIIGWLSEDATYDGKDLFANATFLESEQERIKELAEAGVIGMSIRASGEMTEGANGMELKKFTSVHSVDVVTVAGAGGKFVDVLEAARNPEAVEAKNPKEETELEISKEFIEALEAQNKLTNELLEKLNAREDAEAAKAADLAEAERKALEEAGKPKAPSAAEIAEALVEADLAPKARARVLKAVAAGADLAESIKEEAEIAAEILESAGGNGGGHFEDGKQVSEAERTAKAVANIFG
jgi:hypothetical protein